MSESDKRYDRQQYFSVESPASAEFVTKRSRFIGYVSPVSSVADAEKMIERLKAEYEDATHVCYAYHIGLRTTTSKMSDDGEPQGTAGRPILEVIERRELENVCIAVVRYYGGIQLGAAGLVRAYSAAAVAAVDEATIVEYTVHKHVSIRISYALWAKVEHLFSIWGGQLLDTEYGEDIRIRATVPLSRKKAFFQGLSDATGGTVDIKVGKSEFRPG